MTARSICAPAAAPAPRLFGDDHKFEIGKGQILRDGDDVTIVACGAEVARALAAADMLAEDGISARVVNMPTIKPIDAKLLARCARETGAIVTAEDHNIHGGLGGAVAEALAATTPCPVEFVGVKDTFGASGEPEELAHAFRHLARPSSPTRRARVLEAQEEMSRFSLAGKCAVVTGGSRGIGARHCAGPGGSRRRCAAHLSRESRRGGCRGQSHRSQRPPRHGRADGCHRPRQRRARRPRRRAASAPISILVNNAGINKPTDFDQISDADWDAILATNLKGPLHGGAGFPAAAEEGGRRRHRAYRLGQRPVWRPAHRALCRVQGRA